MFKSPTDWQCVLVLWGNKYGSEDVIRITSNIAKHAASQPTFVLLTDRDRPDVPEHIIQRLIPDFYLQPRFESGGCLTKLAIFQKDVLPSTRPTVFVDLDTVIVGDIGQLLTVLTADLRIAMLANNPLSLNRFARLVYRLSNGRIRTRGNSSFLAFNPVDCYDVDETFRANSAVEIAAGNKAYVADDKFLSATFHQEMTAIPVQMAVKFPREFMNRFVWLGYLKSMLPWVRKRRASLAAITFPGSSVDPEKVIALTDGETVQDTRGRQLIWSDSYLGDTKRVLDAYFDPNANKDHPPK